MSLVVPKTENQQGTSGGVCPALASLLFMVLPLGQMPLSFVVRRIDHLPASALAALPAPDFHLVPFSPAALVANPTRFTDRETPNKALENYPQSAHTSLLSEVSALSFTGSGYLSVHDLPLSRLYSMRPHNMHILMAYSHGPDGGISIICPHQCFFLSLQILLMSKPPDF